MSTCPCQSGLAYSECCEPYIEGNTKAPTAEALMRSRYTAYTQVNMAYIEKTHHPSHRHDLDLPNTETWARQAEWLGLEVINCEQGQANDDRGQVEFKARYRLSDKEYTLHELSDFANKQGTWFYVDGRLPDVQQYVREAPKVGRNDPCICGSGKKFKKCCGRAA